MADPVLSVSLLGLDPGGFRLVHEDEMSPDYDHGCVRTHANGQECRCPWVCEEGEEAA